MLVIRGCREQPAAVAQIAADRPVGGVELGVDDAALAAEPAPILAIFAVALDREHRVDAMRLAQVEIVLAMVGRHVDEAGAGVGGDELAGQERARPGVEVAEAVHRVAGDRSGERRARHEMDGQVGCIAIIGQRAGAMQEGCEQIGGDQDLAAGRAAARRGDQHIIDRRGRKRSPG